MKMCYVLNELCIKGVFCEKILLLKVTPILYMGLSFMLYPVPTYLKTFDLCVVINRGYNSMFYDCRGSFGKTRGGSVIEVGHRTEVMVPN